MTEHAFPEPDSAPRWRSVVIATMNFVVGSALLGAAGHVDGLMLTLGVFLAGVVNYGLGLYRIREWFGRPWRLLGVR